MGLFDSVYVACPHCGEQVEFQSKEADLPYLTAPDNILRDILNRPTYCESCGGWMALLDPRYPITPPRPNPQIVKVKTPKDPVKNDQGMQWWPGNKPFTVNDLEDP